MSEQVGASPKPPEYKDPELSITAPKHEVEMFRVTQALNYATQWFWESAPEGAEVINLTVSSYPEPILDFLSKNEPTLSEQAKLLLRVAAEKNKLITEGAKAQDVVTIKGKEASNFTDYRIDVTFNETLNKLLDSNDPLLDNIMKVTSQRDTLKVAQFITANKPNLTPLALDFLHQDLIIRARYSL